MVQSDLYGLSSDNTYFFLVENSKLLRFFKFSDDNETQTNELKLVSDLYLYCKPMSIICNSEFISLSMTDSKVISYLIGDPNRLEVTIARVNYQAGKNSNFFFYLKKFFNSSNILNFFKEIE